MRWILPFFLGTFILGCCVTHRLPTQPISSDHLRARIRVMYQRDLPHRLETSLHFDESLLLLEEELHITFDVEEVGEFDYTPLPIPQGVPNDLGQELEVMTKMNECSSLKKNDGSAVVCIFDGTLSATEGSNGGIVLGATSTKEAVISLSNLKNRRFFENVTRHEFGHLLGAEHSTDLMSPFIPKKGLKELLPFPTIAIHQIRHNFGLE